MPRIRLTRDVHTRYGTFARGLDVEVLRRTRKHALVQFSMIPGSVQIAEILPLDAIVRCGS